MMGESTSAYNERVEVWVESVRRRIVARDTEGSEAISLMVQRARDHALHAASCDACLALEQS